MNSRSAQLLAAILAFLLILLIAVTIFVLLSRPPSPRPSPTALSSATAPISPTIPASLLPSGTPASLPPGTSPTPTIAPTPTAEPTPEPTPSLPPTPSPSPSPSPSPTPSISPTSPQRELKLIDVGLDNRADEASVQRFVTFVVDGPSLISARLSKVSAGTVRLCLWRQALDDERQCRTVRNQGIERAVLDAGQSVWNLSMIGTAEQTSPFATLTLRFNSLAPNVTLDSFRYVGTVANEYNGFLAELPTLGNGDVRIQASFDDGQGGPYPFRLTITRTSTGEVLVDETGGPAGNIDISQPLTGPDTYRVELRNTDEVAAGGLLPVFVHATLTWP